MDFAVSLPSSSPLEAIITFAPCLANTVAMPFPIPLDPPVTTTELSLIDVNIFAPMFHVI